MARAKVSHSTHAVNVIFEGDKRNPEPPTGVITFPGGHVEVSRCENGDYWAHVFVVNPKNITESRIDYGNNENAYKYGIPRVPAADDIQHIAIRVSNIHPWGENS